MKIKDLLSLYNNDRVDIVLLREYAIYTGSNKSHNYYDGNNNQISRDYLISHIYELVVDSFSVHDGTLVIYTP